MKYYRKTINSMAKFYKVKPEWLWNYMKKYYKYNNLEHPHFSVPLSDEVALNIEIAFGSTELIQGHIDPLVCNNNTRLAKQFGINRISFAKMLSLNENIQTTIKQIQPIRNRYLPWEVRFIIDELGLE